MIGRNTTTGAVLEAMILPALTRGGYACQTQVDVVAARAEEKIVVSLKWQQVSGTAEQKVPFEVICLADVVSCKSCTRAYLVLGGDGWTLRDFYVGGGLSSHLVHADKVRIVTLERFVALANQGEL